MTSMRPELEHALKWACSLTDSLFIARDFDGCSRLYELGQVKTVMTSTLFNLDALPEDLEILAIRNTGKDIFNIFVPIQILEI